MSVTNNGDSGADLSNILTGLDLNTPDGMLGCESVQIEPFVASFAGFHGSEKQNRERKRKRGSVRTVGNRNSEGDDGVRWSFVIVMYADTGADLLALSRSETLICLIENLFVILPKPVA